MDKKTVPSKKRHEHAQKITHRDPEGKFKEPPHKPDPGKIAPKDPGKP